MTADPTRLRFGPYSPPALTPGDLASCLQRDCEVVVTTWIDARIPWPRCRRLGVRGGAGLLVNDELKRAILSESAAAIMHRFGVGEHAVWNWRRTFGVSRYGTPGSRELLAELNHVKGHMGREASRTPDARRKRRETSIRLDLARHLVAARVQQWAESGWTNEQLAKLGTRPDAELAELFGRSVSAVRQRRTRLGIPTFDDRRRKSAREK